MDLKNKKGNIFLKKMFWKKIDKKHWVYILVDIGEIWSV